MKSSYTEQAVLNYQPTVKMGMALYGGYLLIFFTTWILNGVEYTRIGENVETIKLWYALPTLLGCLFLIISLTFLGWWRIVLFDTVKAGPMWVWILPVVITMIIVNNFLVIPFSKLSVELLLWSMLGAISVGFGEEMITRGSMIVGLRSQFSEIKVWLLSTLFFSALHIPNVIFGLPMLDMPIQVLLTFLMGSGFYAIRRISGSLILPMILHGLWDSSLFLNFAAGMTPSLIQFIVYPLAIVCVIVILRKQ